MIVISQDLVFCFIFLEKKEYTESVSDLKARETELTSAEALTNPNLWRKIYKFKAVVVKRKFVILKSNGFAIIPLYLAPVIQIKKLEVMPF